MPQWKDETALKCQSCNIWPQKHKINQIREGKQKGERDYERMIKGKGNLNNTIKV
jgi:hypothetical protein